MKELSEPSQLNLQRIRLQSIGRFSNTKQATVARIVAIDVSPMRIPEFVVLSSALIRG